MDLWQLLLFALIGFTGGALSGLVGVGGGVVFVPGLVYAAGWDIKEATAASLATFLFGALSGTLRSSRGENPVDWRAAVLLSCAVAPSALIGVAINRVSPEAVVQLCFAVSLVVLAYPVARASPVVGSRERRPVLVLLGGVGVGVMAGLLGIGGAVLMTPLMIFGLGLRLKTAMATSLAVALFTGVVGAAGYVATGFDRFASLPPLVVGAVLGAWVGAGSRERVPEKTLQRGFALFMVLVAVQVAFDALNV